MEVQLVQPDNPVWINRYMMDECLRSMEVFSSAHTAHVVYESNHIIREVFRFSLLWPLVYASC